MKRKDILKQIVRRIRKQEESSNEFDPSVLNDSEHEELIRSEYKDIIRRKKPRSKYG